MNMGNILYILIGLYIVAECIDAACQMNKGDKLSTMLKYGSAVGVGGILIVKGFDFDVYDWLAEPIFTAAVVTQLWTRMIYRFGGNRFTDRMWQK